MDTEEISYGIWYRMILFLVGGSTISYGIDIYSVAVYGALLCYPQIKLYFRGYEIKVFHGSSQS